MSSQRIRKTPCDPTEVALKSYFLGPQSENAAWLMEQVWELLQGWFAWRQRSFPEDGSAIAGADRALPEYQARQARMRDLTRQLSLRFESELPKFSPRYVGHMFSELSMPALLGHVVTLLHNPNIIARESATVASDIENEAIVTLGQMVGLPSTHGHFTSGGTLANFEAVARACARMHLWMAAAAAAGAELSLFQSAHLGWRRFEVLRADLTEEDMAPFLPESVGPWQAAQALERAFQTACPGPALIVPHSAHYSWKKAARLFGIGERQLYLVECDPKGRYRVDLLEARIARCREENQPIAAVVSVAGSTETGAIDPIDEIDALLARVRRDQDLEIWHHVDAAYGGFFCSMLDRSAGGVSASALSLAATRALGAIGRADSVTLDPHKLGYVPYSSGAFLTARERDYTCVRVLAPYLDYRSDHGRGDRGPYTLEGSRSAAGAVATWLTARAIGLDPDGYGLLLARTIRQKQKLEAWLTGNLSSARVFPACDTNLLCFCLADPDEAVSAINARTLRILDRLSGESRYYLTKTAFPLQGSHAGVARSFVAGWNGTVDEDQILVLRACLMNPFFDSAELDVDHIQRLVVSLCEVAD